MEVRHKKRGAIWADVGDWRLKAETIWATWRFFDHPDNGSHTLENKIHSLNSVLPAKFRRLEVNKGSKLFVTG